MATFLQVRSPLYRIKDSFVGIDTEALFGNGIISTDLNDDAIGRALDRIGDSLPGSLFSTLCLSLYGKFNIAFKRLHSDTTTISFYGEYEENNEITYIADSKLINMPLFKILMDPQNKVRFISRCPASFNNKTAGKVICRAWEDTNTEWIQIGKISTGKKASSYEIKEYTEKIESHEVRLIVVKSSEGRKRIQRKLDKQHDELEKAIAAIAKKKFACRADAEEECFVLITNVEKSELLGEEVLSEYKEQSIVEVQFKMLKEPALASTIFLKMPKRIDALMMLLNISLLIRGLVQYKIRKSVECKL